ncbi:AvrE-family type 3 secretion system effector [Pseudomonas abietaniphila]|uniref:AvrE-family type 3 secretion system effector n=1 Tax=Pseudomonas abietaniphila TaxID=89065 RepID=UPI000A5BAD63|nr:AvrE-family type 3 secretion system effector [Pseudomonas abietaniphila]
MALTPHPLNPALRASHVSPGGSAESVDDPRQRKGVLARVATFSQSTISKGRHLATGLFKAKQGDASSIPRSTRSATPSLSPTPPVGTRASTPEAIEMGPRLNIALSNAANHQQLIFGTGEHLNRTEKLLDSILNKPGQYYQGVAELNLNDEKTEYLMVDAEHRLVHAHASERAVSVFKSSENRPNNASNVPLPDNAHRAQITGVHVDENNKAWRLHEATLYALENGKWTTHAAISGLKSLHSTGDGKVYGLSDDGKVRSLHHPDAPLPFTHKVLSLATTPKGELVALSEDPLKNLTVERLNAFGEGLHDVQALTPPTGTRNDEAFVPKAVAIVADTLFATSASGKLLQAHLRDHDLMPSLDPDAPAGALVPRPPVIGLPLKLSVALSSANLTAAYGNYSISDLFNDEQGGLHARVKDQKGVEHSASWDNASQDFRPGWQMAPLIMDRQNGLPALNPLPHQQIHLARGSIARHGDDLLVQDPRTEVWKKTSEKSIKGLQRGQDGFAYLIDKDSKLKQLKVAPQASAHGMGSGVDLALPGRGTEAKGTVMRGAEHLQVDQVAVQNDQKYMTLSGGKLRLHDQNSERATLPLPPGTGPVQAISSGGKDWYALRDDVLFRLPGQSTDPKAIQGKHPWEAITLTGPAAGARLEDIRPASDGRLLASTDQGEFVRAPDGTWSTAQSKAGPARQAHRHYDQLVAGEPAFTRRGNLKTSFNVLGRGNVETIKAQQFAPNTLTQNYVTAHISPTGAIKVPADSIQHAWKGREGLRRIYTDERDVLQALTLKASEAVMNPDSASLSARIDALKKQPASPQSVKLNELTELFDWFQKGVVEDMQRTLRELAQGQNALLKNGAINPQFQGKPRADDMLADIAQVARHSGIDDAHPLGQLLASLQDKHFTLEHRNPQTALDSSRKRGDDQALLRARLALDVKVLSDLSTQLDGLTREAKKPGHQDLDTFAKNLATLHNDVYEGNSVKRYTDAGFRNHAALEASYDATKSLLKYMRKDNHPVKRNVLQGLESSPQDLVGNLTIALRDLEPRESLKLNRNYGGGITGGVSGPEGQAFLGFRGSIDPERTYGLTFTRFDRGLKVALSREGAISGTASFGFGGGISDTKNTPGDSHKNIQSNAGWFGGSLDAKHKYTDNTALSFFIRDDELEDFIGDLMQTPLHTSKRPDDAGLKPMALMDRGVEKEVRTGSKHTFDLDLGLNLESRTNYGQTDAEPVAGFMRFGAGLLASLSLLSAERERTEGRGSDGLTTDIYSSNRARFLEKGSVSVYARMFSTVFSSRPDNLFIAGGAPLGVTASLSFDNKTGKSYDVRFKHALPVQDNDVKSLGQTLEKSFPEMTKNPSDSGKSAEQTLQHLKAKYLGTGPAKNDAQYAALTSLRQLDRQNTAARQGSSLMSLMDMVVKHNNVNRIDQVAMSKRGIDWTKKLFGLDVNAGNAEHIHALMSADPQLKGLLDELKSTKGTTRAELKLEVKDEIKQRIEDRALAGNLTDEALKAMLADKDNLRIKSISIFRSAAKDDALGIALPYVSFKSGSNLSIERLRGEVTFEYGLDQTRPKAFSLDGEQADQHDPQPAREMASDSNGGYRPS